MLSAILIKTQRIKRKGFVHFYCYYTKHRNNVHCSAGTKSDKITQEWDREKEEKTKAESLEEKNKLSEEKLWQPGGVGSRPSNEEGGKLKCNFQLKIFS